MAENEPQAPEIGDDALTQEALDALLAAATAENDDQPSASDAAAEEVAQEERRASVDSIASAPEAVRPTGAVDLPLFDASSARTFGRDGGNGMTRVRDIPLEVTVELGRTRILIRDILDLGAGSIIELDKIAGEPVDLFANGLLVARGEVIVIDDNFGVRVTEIITAAERSQMKEIDALAA